MDHKGFSRAAKIALSKYLLGEVSVLNDLELFIENVQNYRLELLNSDDERKAFWINIYNGFTNYQIVKNRLQKSVWEKSDFFTNRSLRIGEIDFSLDDIEHGILRRNGDRKNDRPKQFLASDPRLQFMLEKPDFRIHFALNCGSVSCPPISYYDEANIDQQLTLAEGSFSEQEFVVNRELKNIECSSIFVWYRNDFEDCYLNAPELSHYTVVERPYVWEIQ